MQIINLQPIEKLARSDGSVLDVHSIFYTIQGEGPFTGRPAIFIRLAGCNLQCPSCDTDYTNGRSVLSLHTIMEAVRSQSSLSHRKPMIVITGGEPFRQNILPLCAALISHDHIVQIETNGTAAPKGSGEDDLVWSKVHIVCSPKAGKVQDWIRFRATAFKYVLSHDSINPNDGLPILALNHTAAPQVARPVGLPRDRIYLQPMDAKDPAINKLNINAVVESCKKFGYTVQLQTHKYLEVE
jgi:organic radical activating enzyme